MRHETPKGGLTAELAAFRRRRGITQAELARRLGVAAPHLSRIEHGTDPRLSTFVDIARGVRAEPILVPKEHVAAVRALLRDLSASGDDLERPRFG